jgi:signal transduction histidine kinase
VKVGADVKRGDLSRRREPRWWRSKGSTQEAEAAALLDDEQRQLLADIGHELKSPLSIMLALTSRLAESERLGPGEAADVARIRANAYTMLRRVQDLMLITRLESAEMQLAPALVDVAAVVHGCAEGFTSVAEQRELRLAVGVPHELPAVVDDEKLVSAISNLMANAIRHARHGGIVRCSLRASDRELVIEVADDGPGVPEEHRERIFERYRRTRSATSTGLGLAIVREIAALHGGAVTAGDAPEGGALFTMALPRRSPRTSEATPRSVRSLGIAEHQKAIVEDLRAELAL